MKLKSAIKITEPIYGPKLKKDAIKLNLGSGIGLMEGFINVDILPESEIRKGAKTKKGFFQNAVVQPNAEYVEANLVKLPFEDNYADYAIMLEVIEHQAFRYVQTVMNEIHRVLKPGAMLALSTPDFNTMAQLWIDNIAKKVGKYKDFDQYRYLTEIIYGNQTHDGEFHRCPMTPDFVNYLYEVAGFRNVKVFVWPLHSKPGFHYPGMQWPKNAIMRSPTIIAEGIK